jgi:hypothetical protein
MIYILNRDGQVIATAGAPVNEQDLATRGEIAIVSNLDLPPEQVGVVNFPTAPEIIEKPQVNLKSILLETNADDQDGDGLPDLAADGESQIEIAASTFQENGELETKPVRILFRTTAGSLSKRFVESSDGRATVTLTAGRETVQVAVTAEAEGFAPGRILLEFIPPD